MKIKPFFQKPETGSVLVVAAGLSFFVTCMLLPLVGRAGSSVPYAGKNQITFLCAVGVSFLFAALATASKISRRAVDESPFPIYSTGLCCVCVLLFVLQLSGLLAI